MGGSIGTDLGLQLGDHLGKVGSGVEDLDRVPRLGEQPSEMNGRSSRPR